MFKLNRQGLVFANGKFCGYLNEFRDAQLEKYTFEYDHDYMSEGVPMGYHFPFTKNTFEFDTFPPFFSNLISEGWLRTHQSKLARLDKTDSFGLLLANGKELIGALSVVPSENKYG
ncbi:HipA N-terminal domain-containing protein [Thalassotalea piscium]|uniref:Serine/threonine-protein kinase HipA n=1 Tax=Thalassotalea piscium TaxID=1230533 RepID=A0A7X0TSW2_9GAMM|nr:HipA N-terminal domain-containing protein [Thalassotalea piscium]MBB6542534.1 serine/threonine-protein kinase HipA [Thalassotalea piscium]